MSGFVVGGLWSEKYYGFLKKNCWRTPETKKIRHIISGRCHVAGLEICMCIVCVLSKLNGNRVFQKQKRLKYAICLVYSPRERG